MNHKSIVQAMITAAAITAVAVAQTISTGGAVSGQVVSRLGVATGCCGPGPAVITGQPYSAQQEIQTIQTLSDGTHITSGLQKVTYYRDSLGRTRIERTPAPMPGFLGSSPADEPLVFITITDPIAGYSYSFDSKSHTAHRSPLPVQISKGLFPAASINLPAPGLVATVAARASSAQNPQFRPQISNESLGSKTIEGVLAEGHRTTTTWPVGAFGNDRPVTTVNEEWMSRELGMNVLNTTSDPRSGEATTRLLNISRAEPDPSLFEPPAGYEIIDPAGQATQK
jgi:hypothetical protein